MRRVLALLACLALGGCVYYNGVYNARRLTRDAERAERDGRRFEAQSLYGQVAAKAESVVVRHPRSDWVDDARFLRGNALARMNNCAGARPELEAVAYSSPDQSLARRALDVLADCYADLGEWDHAADALARLRSEVDSAARVRAAGRLFTAFRTNGRYGEALALMAEEPALAPPPGDRAVVLAGSGRPAEALRLVDTLLVLPDAAGHPWDSLAAVLGRADLELAASLTDRLAVQDSLPAELRTRLLLADAERWRGPDTARARLRWQQAAALAPANASRGTARLALAAQAVEHAAEVESLRPLVDSLRSIERMGGGAAVLSARRRVAIERAVADLDSLREAGPPTAQGDLVLFRAAEILRDSAGAPRAAGAVLRQLIESHPESPYAPKALLARAELDPGAADSLSGAAIALYPGSPYVRALRGEATDSFAVLEDSLRRWSSASRGPGRRGPARQPADTLR